MPAQQAHRNDHDLRDDDRIFLSATEVGRQLGIRKSRVYELAAGGLLPSVRLGRRILFPRRGLERLADAAIERAAATAALRAEPTWR